MTRAFVARSLDVLAFAEAGGTLAAQDVIAAFPRLAAETQGQGADRPVSWAARGELRNGLHLQPEVWMELDARATLALTCQRCLGEMDVPVEVSQSFRFVADEATAQALDDEAEEDVLALSRSFDLVDLVEDEILMALPLVPRHAECPMPVTTAVADADFEEAPAAHPFAALGKLKRGTG